MLWPSGSQDLSPVDFFCGDLYEISFMLTKYEITSSMSKN
jgi:hypothetical protein